MLLQEFCAAALNHSLLERKGLLEETFRKFDLDKDGFLSPAEMLQVCGMPGLNSF